MVCFVCQFTIYAPTKPCKRYNVSGICQISKNFIKSIQNELFKLGNSHNNILLNKLSNRVYYGENIFLYFQSMCRSEKKSLKGYFLAGRNVTWWPVRCTLQYISILISDKRTENTSSVFMSMHK